MSATLSFEDKKRAMEEWWTRTHSLIEDAGMKRLDVETCVRRGEFAFRDGIVKFFEALHDSEVPTLILSAGVADVVEEVLKQHLPGAAKSRFISVISNRLVYDKEDKVVGFEPKGRPIHTLNKGVVAVEGSLHHALAKERTRVVLLGDNLGDLHMADGLSDKEHVLSIGFLNDQVGERFGQYLQGFDVVVLNGERLLSLSHAPPFSYAAESLRRGAGRRCCRADIADVLLCPAH